MHIWIIVLIFNTLAYQYCNYHHFWICSCGLIFLLIYALEQGSSKSSWKVHIIFKFLLFAEALRICLFISPPSLMTYDSYSQCLTILLYVFCLFLVVSGRRLHSVLITPSWLKDKVSLSFVFNMVVWIIVLNLWSVFFFPPAFKNFSDNSLPSSESSNFQHSI